MTPGNIVGMAALNGLSAIAVTDHNASMNSEAAAILGKNYGITVVPGLELETAEQIHVVCLFPDQDGLSRFQEILLSSYGGAVPLNRTDIFGRQLLFNTADEVCGELDRMLLASTGITIDDSFGLAASLGGIAYPAHVDRDSYREILLKNFPELENYKLLPSSDAHYIDKIQEEGGAVLEVEEPSAAGIIDALRQGRIL